VSLVTSGRGDVCNNGFSPKEGKEKHNAMEVLCCENEAVTNHFTISVELIRDDVFD